ncbi:MAG: TetR/AcrR family transcriptional regulator [Candidatus Aminicenantes bacterium]|nr:TetR/AcrR family transcriptional regulator [Candidatus Aminicenantes bacterium]
MAAKKHKEPKQRILDAAITLFAQKGYAAVGVREIVKTADVNIAMISYYFDGKVGIIKAVIKEFFDHFLEIFSEINEKNKSSEENMRLIIRPIINFIRSNTKLAMVAYNELPLDIPEITELKAERTSFFLKKMSSRISGLGLDPKEAFRTAIIGTSLFSAIMMQFRFRPVIERVYKVKYDDAYYKWLEDTITTLFLNGIQGIVTGKKKRVR